VQLQRQVALVTCFLLLARSSMPWLLYGLWAYVFIGYLALILAVHRGPQSQELHLVAEAARVFVNFGVKVFHFPKDAFSIFGYFYMCKILKNN
jgi:hypothetical protein